MALFFDQEWFDARLKARQTTRGDIARLLGLSEPQVDEIWKDQRELNADDVARIARFLGVEPREIALRAGVSTPTPSARGDLEDRVDELARRVSELERKLNQILSDPVHADTFDRKPS